MANLITQSVASQGTSLWSTSSWYGSTPYSQADSATLTASGDWFVLTGSRISTVNEDRATYSSIPVSAGTKYQFSATAEDDPNTPGGDIPLAMRITWSGGSYEGGNAGKGYAGKTEWTCPAGVTSVNIHLIMKSDSQTGTAPQRFTNVYFGHLPPTVSAGPDKTVSMPNAVTLSGTITDNSPTSGTPTAQWSKVSGPGTVTFANATSANTTATFSVEGSYTLRLTATEDGQSVYDDVIVTVNPIQPPTVYAGGNKYFTTALPLTVNLEGSITDNDPSTPAATAQWAKVSGPGNVTFADASATTTTATIDAFGTYELSLTATDNGRSSTDTMTIVIQEQTAAGGITENPVLGPNLITQSNPAQGTSNWLIADDATAPTNNNGWFRATNALGGTMEIRYNSTVPVSEKTSYQLSFDWACADDNFYATVYIDYYTNAGQTMSLSNYRSSVIAFDAYSLENTTRVNFHTPAGCSGVRFRIEFTYFNAGMAFDYRNVYLGTFDTDSTTNSAWLVDARFDGSNGVRGTNGVNGVANIDGKWWKNTWVDGTYTKAWTSYAVPVTPGTVTSAGVLAKATDINNSAGAGTDAIIQVKFYTSAAHTQTGSTLTNTVAVSASEARNVFVKNFTVPSDAGYLVLKVYPKTTTASMGLDITNAYVGPMPTVNAGSDQTITIPDSVSLNGTASGTAEWTLVSGPGPVLFDSPGSAVTTAYMDTQGTYVLRLTATENGLSDYDEVTITVLSEVDQPPVVNAGPDKTITLPDNAALNGSASDDRGTVTVTWSATGPGTVTFDNPNAAATTAAFGVAGTYTLTLTANDGVNTPVSDSLTVNVNPAASVPPTVDAGASQSVRLSNVARLEGVVSTNTTSVQWTSSGPGTATFSSPNSAQTNVMFDTVGTYTLTLTAEADGIYASDSTTVTVTEDVAPVPTNTAPTVNAGTDKTIVHPNPVSLNGVVTDDGSYTVLWTATGPGTVTFANAASKSTTATFSTVGTYTLTLTADDGEFTASDSVVVTVQAEAPADPTPGTNEPPPDLGTAPPAGADPTGDFVDGDTWFQRNANNVIIGHWEFHGGYWYAKAVGNQVIANLDAGKITTGYLDASRINVNTITSSKLADGAVTGSKISDGVIDSTKITPGAITATALADGAVTSTKIVGGAITTSHIATSGIDAGVIKTGTMHGDRITANTITGDKILARSIGSDKIVANAITAYELSTYAITANHLTANNVIANAVTAADMTAATITGSTIQTGTSNYGTIKIRGAYNDMVMYSPSGQRMFYIDASTGYVELNGVIKTSPSGQRIEMGNTGANDPADEIRMFNGASVVSMRNLTDSPGHVYFSLQRQNYNYSSAFSMYPTADGHMLAGRGSILSNGAKIKYLSGADGIQVRNGADNGYAPIRASAFNTSSYERFKKNIERVEVSNTAEILKSNGLQKWDWNWQTDFPEIDVKTGKPTSKVVKASEEAKQGMGLMADSLPEFLQTKDGYSLTAVVGFLWDALKESNERIAELEKKGKPE